MDKSKRHLAWWVVGALAVAAVVAWWLLRPAGVPEGFAVSNGRIEATEVDIASKIAGRIDTILVKEGQFVREGEVLAKMDTRVLQEQRLEAIAQIKEAQSAVAAAQALLEQRQSETRAAQSLVNQRQAELDSVAKRHMRSRSLAQRGAISAQQLDDDRAAAESARAALESAKAQVSASKAAIEAARTNIIQAQTRVEAAQATERRIAADIDDSELKAPRDGRVQYRVAEPGEVLAAGGRVLNMVDLSDVYMTFFLPTEQAGTLKLGGEARLILDAAPDLRIPATISFVASVAQFTPKTVETSDERLKATERRIAADIDDSELKAPRDGRVQYRVAEPGEVLAAGGRVLNMVDLSDVYMTFFLPTEQAGTLKLGGEARLILDAAPDLRIPATISFVASVAQFTPKTVETSDERLKLMFRVKARIPPELLQQHLEYVKTGLPGVAWVRVNEELPWPDDLVVRLPQ